MSAHAEAATDAARTVGWVGLRVEVLDFPALLVLGHDVQLVDHMWLVTVLKWLAFSDGNVVRPANCRTP